MKALGLFLVLFLVLIPFAQSTEYISYDVSDLDFIEYQKFVNINQLEKIDKYNEDDWIKKPWVSIVKIPVIDIAKGNIEYGRKMPNGKYELLGDKVFLRYYVVLLEDGNKYRMEYLNLVYLKDIGVCIELDRKYEQLYWKIGRIDLIKEKIYVPKLVLKNKINKTQLEYLISEDQTGNIDIGKINVYPPRRFEVNRNLEIPDERLSSIYSINEKYELAWSQYGVIRIEEYEGSMRTSAKTRVALIEDIKRTGCGDINNITQREDGWYQVIHKFTIRTTYQVYGITIEDIQDIHKFLKEFEVREQC